jgi:glycosyltransferase involved in cell wall biosynthesis
LNSGFEVTMNIIRKSFLAYRNKVSNRLTGVVTLPAVGIEKGVVLMCYLTGPFTLAPWEHFTDPHTSYWECHRMAELFSERGYAVDIIDVKNTTFVPQKPYVVCIDAANNLERFSKYLPLECKKVMHILHAEASFQNAAELSRLTAFEERRHVSIRRQRVEPETKNPAYADYLEGFGNNTIRKTYSKFRKDIYPIPISTAQEFAFPEHKDFAEIRKSFLWFGGGGALLKGLDLVIEAFAQAPHLSLSIVGPAAYENEFSRAYKKELASPNIQRYPRPKIDSNGNISTDGVPLIEIMNKCVGIIYPSASEGTSGAVIQAMHAGLIPIVTKESGINEHAPAVICDKPTVESVRELADRIAHMSPEDLQKESHKSWTYARAHHTQQTFGDSYADFIDTFLSL